MISMPRTTTKAPPVVVAAPPVDPPATKVGGISTLAKVGIGVGATLAVGGAATGVAKLLSHGGSWGTALKIGGVAAGLTGAAMVLSACQPTPVIYDPYPAPYDPYDPYNPYNNPPVVVDPYPVPYDPYPVDPGPVYVPGPGTSPGDDGVGGYPGGYPSGGTSPGDDNSSPFGNPDFG